MINYVNRFTHPIEHAFWNDSVVTKIGSIWVYIIEWLGCRQISMVFINVYLQIKI